MKIIPQSFHGFWSSDQNLRVFLWLLIVHVFFLMPFSLLEDTGKFLLSIFFTLLFIAGANAVIQSRRVFILVASVLFLAVFVHWLGWVVEHRTVDILGTATGIVFLLIVIGLLGTMVIGAKNVSLHTIEGGIAIYLLIALLWGQIYLLLERLSPGSFHFAVQDKTPEGTKAALSYFSLVTITTVGYGDVTAVHPLARSFAALEAFIGQIYPVVLLARLVSLEIVSRAERLD